MNNNGKAYLLEVNGFPSLAMDSPCLQDLIPSMVKDFIDTVFKAQPMKPELRNKCFFEKKPPRSIGGFELILDEANDWRYKKNYFK